MSQIKLENVSGLVPIETVLPDPGRVHSQAAKAESFDDHLWRVQAQSEEITAGGQPDSARLSPPQPAPADAPGQPAADRESAADDQSGEPRDSADVDPDENVTGQVSPEETSENDQAEAAETETEADDQQSSQTAEAGSQAGQEQKTDADPGVNEAKAAGPRNVLGKPSLKQPDGQVDKDNAGQPAADHTSAEQEGRNKKAPQHAVPKEQVNSASPAAQILPKQAATQGSPAPRGVAEENPTVGTDSAETNPEASGKTPEQETDGTSGKATDQTLELIQPDAEATAATGRNRSETRGDRADEASGRQPDSRIQVSQAAAPLRAQREGESENAAGKQPPRNPASAAAAANPQADAQVVSTEPAPSAAEQTSVAGDLKAHAAEETAKPAVTAAPDSPLNVPLRISPSQEPRVGSTSQPRQASESGQVDQARFVRRVARAFRAIGKRGGSVRLRLSPPQLGSLRLEVTVRNGLMTARVEAETPTARNLLLDNLPALRDRLAQQDIKVKQFDVGLMDRSPGGLPDQTADHTQSRHRGGGSSAPATSAESDREANTISDPGAANRPGEGTQLNVVI